MKRVARPIVSIDLPRVRQNAWAIAHRTNTPLIVVIKANAYGLGAREIVTALQELVAGFYCFTMREAVDAATWETGKPAISLIPNDSDSPKEYREYNVRPAVWDVERATALQTARPVLAVDTGMQRFGCPHEHIDEVLAAGACDEAFTHATTIESASLFGQWMRNRGLRLHAAGTALLDHGDAYFDFVRPGYALYHDAVRVVAPLVDARESKGALGYRGAQSATARHGLILAGYANGLRPGPCIVNGHPRRILECGMQSSYIEIGPGDREDDEVILLGDGLSAETIGKSWNATPHEALMRMASCGRREYRW